MALRFLKVTKISQNFFPLFITPSELKILSSDKTDGEASITYRRARGRPLAEVESDGSENKEKNGHIMKEVLIDDIHHKLHLYGLILSIEVNFVCPQDKS